MHEGAESKDAHRVLADALKNLDKQMLNAEDTVFRQVVFAAPDIDREVFLNQIAPAIVNDHQHFTLYASSSDRALMLSKAFSGGPRAGDSLPEPVVVSGIDTIDATGIDTSLLGHSYYADPRALVDLFDLLGRNTAAAGRQGLDKKDGPRGLYWIFKPRETLSP
jgi:esterase/lipase superfamily enzyme